MSIGTISIITRPGNFEREYFLNNPDITFFKSVYRKHTNFCKYLKSDNLLDNKIMTAKFGINTHKIQTGSDDLLAKIYLENKIIIESKAAPTGTDITIFANLGSNFIGNDDDALSITIGNNRSLFKSDGLFQEVKGELLNQMSLINSSTGTHAPELTVDGATDSQNKGVISCKNGSHYNYTTLSGGVRGIGSINSASFSASDTLSTEYFYTIPEFSFMKDYGLALPLLSMRNNNINFNVKFKTPSELMSFGANQAKYNVKYNSNVIQELIQLDTEEKSRFLTSQLSYLTESINKTPIQINKNPDIKSNLKLCKYILLVGEPPTLSASYNASNSKTVPSELNLKTLDITVGGPSIYSGAPLNKEIFTKININKYFIGCGRDLSEGTASDNHRGQLDTIAMIPFSLNPLNYTQPSGCISNEGQVGSIRLSIEKKNVDKDLNMILYSVNYNILQISDGQAHILNV